jgi:hypothetical protein
MYAIFLHEAGHILSPTQIEPEIANGLAFLNVSNTFQQQNEIDAWQWAAKNALSWTRHMTDMAVKALQTYGIKL